MPIGPSWLVTTAPIDLVVCNLYPFEKTVADPSVSFEDAIEQIDTGWSHSLARRCKNCARVTVLCDPNDYGNLIARIDEGAT